MVFVDNWEQPLILMGRAKLAKSNLILKFSFELPLVIKLLILVLGLLYKISVFSKKNQFWIRNLTDNLFASKALIKTLTFRLVVLITFNISHLSLIIYRFFPENESKQKIKCKTNLLFFGIFICHIHSKNSDYSRKYNYFFFQNCLFYLIISIFLFYL